MDQLPDEGTQHKWTSPIVVLFIFGLIGTNVFSYLNYHAQQKSGVLEAREHKLDERREVIDQRELLAKSEAEALEERQRRLEAEKEAIELDTKLFAAEKRSLENASASIRDELRAMERLRALHLNMHPMNKGTEYAIHVDDTIRREDLLGVLPEIRTLKTVSYIDLLNPDIGVEDLQKSLGSESQRIRHLSCQFAPDQRIHDLSKFPGLHSLEVSFTGASDAEGFVRALGRMEALQSLVVHGESVRSPSNADSIRLPHLKHVGLRGRVITSMFFDFVQCGDKVETFTAPYSLDTPKRLTSLARFRSLKTVDIAGTAAISADAFALFVSGVKLQHLAIPDCTLEVGTIQRAYRHLGNLEYLDVSRTPISEADWDAIARLPKLKSLIAQGCDLSSGQLAAVGQCRELQSLVLNQARLDSRGVSFFDEHRSLERIHLAFIDLPDLVPPRSSHLKEVDISGTNTPMHEIVDRLLELPSIESLFWAFADLTDIDKFSAISGSNSLKLVSLPCPSLPPNAILPQNHALRIVFRQDLWSRHDYGTFVPRDSDHARQESAAEWNPTIVTPQISFSRPFLPSP